MKRVAFELSYNGTHFFGWQRQPKQISVQEEIENALRKLNRGTAIPIVGCGRTDTGVHAKHYILHVDLPEAVYHTDLTYKLNKMLPASISIQRIFEVAPDFHARFDASARTYRYFIHREKDPFKQEFSLYYPQALDFEAMNFAASYLIGKKDFTSFSKLHTDVKTNICDLKFARWVQVDESSCYFEIKADRFLRNMVRATVGTLLEVGTGKIPAESIHDILAAMDRGAAKLSVPGHALFLWKIDYPTI